MEMSLSTDTRPFPSRVFFGLRSLHRLPLPALFMRKAAPPHGAQARPLSLTPHLLPLAFPCLFHVPPPRITKKFISRVCGALCRGAYGASCIINDNSATHVFY